MTTGMTIGKNSPHRSVWTGRPDRTERTGRPAHDSMDRTVGTVELGTKRAGTGQQEEGSWGTQDGRDSAAGTGKLGQDSQDRTAGEDSWDSTARVGNRGQDGQNMTVDIGLLGSDKRDGTTVAVQSGLEI
jgi:hypothetical protein